MDGFSFEKLGAYRQALKLVRMVYELTEKFPTHERYGLYNQLHRSIVSVPSNVAESCGRRSYKEKIHFLEIAYGSLLEAYCQIQIAVIASYLDVEDMKNIKPQFFIVSRLLSSLSNSYAKHLNI